MSRAPRLLIAASLLASACHDASGPAGPSATPDLTPPAALAVQGPTGEQVMLARQVAGFGGLFLDESGRPTVYLTDVRQRQAAERALAPIAQLHGFDWERSFRSYEDARYKRTARVQIMSRYYGDAYHAAGVVRELRNDILASAPGAALDFEGMAWLYDGISLPRETGGPEPAA